VSIPRLAPRFVRNGSLGYGYGNPGYLLGGGYQNQDGSYQATPGIVMVGPEPAQPAPPLRPVQAEVHDYATMYPAGPADGPSAQFSIVGKDHVTHAALAVWAQGGMLQYVEAGGPGGQMPLSAVDRDATRQANAAKGLRLQVPAE